MAETAEKLKGIPVDWAWRWCVLPSYGKLHRIAKAPKEDRKFLARGGQGRTICGIKGRVTMPGFISRLGRERCKKCCRIMGVPQGSGAPYNTFKNNPKLRDL